MNALSCRYVEVTNLIDIFFFQAEDGIRDYKVTGVQTCALPICLQHELIVGLDYNRSRSSFDSYIADGPQLDIYRPVYGSFIDTSLLQPDALRDEQIGRAHV